MSRNGSGTYSLPAGNPVVTATTITSTWANTTLTDIATALTGSLAADGQTPAIGNLNMNTNQIKNVVDPSAAQDAATKAYVDAAIPSTANFLTKANNLSDVANATTARGNLTAAKSGANSDITSLTGLTTALSVAQGGTGVATLTANNVLLGNGTSAFQAVAPGTSGNVLTSNGTTWTSAASSSVYVGERGQVFTSSGTYTIPTGVSAIKVTVVGGGGGGGGSNSGSGWQNGAGGGGGGYGVQYFTGLTPGNTLTVTIGAAGSGGGLPSNGGAGGTSSIASGTQTITTLSCTGGGGGSFQGSPAGSGGTVSGAAFSIAGGSGCVNFNDVNSNNLGGSGGAAGGGTAVGLIGGGTIPAVVGSGIWGQGGLGSTGNAGAAKGYGSGGAGTTNSTNGGAGTAGIVIVEW